MNFAKINLYFLAIWRQSRFRFLCIGWFLFNFLKRFSFFLSNLKVLQYFLNSLWVISIHMRNSNFLLIFFGRFAFHLPHICATFNSSHIILNWDSFDYIWVGHEVNILKIILWFAAGKPLSSSDWSLSWRLPLLFSNYWRYRTIWATLSDAFSGIWWSFTFDSANSFIGRMRRVSIASLSITFA